MEMSDGLTSYLDLEVQSQLRRGQVESETAVGAERRYRNQMNQCNVAQRHREDADSMGRMGKSERESGFIWRFSRTTLDRAGPTLGWTELDWAGSGLGLGRVGTELDRCTNSAFTRATRTK